MLIEPEEEKEDDGEGLLSRELVNDYYNALIGRSSDEDINNGHCVTLRQHFGTMDARLEKKCRRVCLEIHGLNAS